MTPESPFYENTLKFLKDSPLFGQLDEATLIDVLQRCRRETWKHRRLLPSEETWQLSHFALGSGAAQS